MGGSMGIAWWDVIRYHTANPHHFPFLRYYMQPVLVFIPYLMHGVLNQQMNF